MASREPLSPRRRPQQARSRELVRAIAMAFDKYLRTDRERVRYSKVI